MAKPPGKRSAKSRGGKSPLARAANGRFASSKTVTQAASSPKDRAAEFELSGGSQEIRDLARHHTRLALETLAQVALSSADEKTRLAAAEALLDRGWGKPAPERRDQEAAREQQPIVVHVETGIRREIPICGVPDGDTEPD